GGGLWNSTPAAALSGSREPPKVNPPAAVTSQRATSYTAACTVGEEFAGGHLVNHVSQRGKIADSIGAAAMTPARVINHMGHMVVNDGAVKAILLERHHNFELVVNVALVDKAFGE